MSEVLEKERQDLLTALQHLERSNKELQQILEEQGPEQEYRAAIGENIVAIAKKRSRLEYIEKELGMMRGNNVSTTSTDQVLSTVQSDQQVEPTSMDVDNVEEIQKLEEDVQNKQQNGSGTWL